jgi:hypothetical protein
MSFTKRKITGRIVLPNEVPPNLSKVVFQLTRFDTDATADSVVLNVPVEAPIDALGNIDIDLWVNDDGVRDTLYSVAVHIENGFNPVIISLGKIEVPSTSGPFDLNDLLAIAPPPGATVEDYIAYLQAALAAAEGAIAAADALEGAVYQVQNVTATVAEQTDYAIGYDPGSADWIQVHLNGQRLIPDQYSIVYPSGVPTLRLTTAPSFGGENLAISGVQAIAYDPNLNRVENLGTRAALVTHISGEGAVSGQIYSDGERLYRTIPAAHALFGTDPIPDLPGLMWFGDRTPNHFGWVGNGTETDQKLGNLALTFAGDVWIKSGDYTFTNSNPITDGFPTGDETECNWWAVRRAWYIGRDDVRLIITSGVTFTAEDNSDCHFIQIGQPLIDVRNSGGVSVGTTTYVSCNRVTVQSLGRINMNGENQTVATDTDFHTAAVWVQNGATLVVIDGIDAYDGQYYGIGFEGLDFEDEQGFLNCRIRNCRLEDFKGDGIDCKDFGTTSSGSIAEGNYIKNCGAKNWAGGSSQSGIDVRNWTVRNNVIEFTDAFAGERDGIRAQHNLTNDESNTPTIIVDNFILGNGSAGVTRGIRAIAANVTTRGNIIRDFDYGIWVSSPRYSSSQDQAYDCGTGLRLDRDTVAGWQSDNADITGFESQNCTTGVRFIYSIRPTLTACKIIGGTTGWDIESTASGIRINGGMNTASTAYSRAGSGSLFIEDVQGFTTKTAVLANFPVDSSGVKTITVPHGLPFTPSISDVQVTVQLGATTGFTFSIPPSVSSTVAPDATNVTVVGVIGTGTGVPGNVTNIRVTIEGFGG